MPVNEYINAMKILKNLKFAVTEATKGNLLTEAFAKAQPRLDAINRRLPEVSDRSFSNSTMNCAHQLYGEIVIAGVKAIAAEGRQFASNLRNGREP